MELLANNYLTNKGDVHFMAMHNDISEVTSHEPPDFPRRPFRSFIITIIIIIKQTELNCFWFGLVSRLKGGEVLKTCRSELVLKPDDSEWSQSRYSVVDKLRAKAQALFAGC